MSRAMTLEELEDWIDHRDPPPLVDGVSMLDGYLAAIIVGPCSISPYEWMDHGLGTHGDIGVEGTTQTAAKDWPRLRSAIHRSLSAPMTERLWPVPGAWGSWLQSDSATRLGDRRDPGPGGEAFLRNAYHDIPLMIPAIRDYGMPQRVRESSS
jgi:uncharacterized protein